MIFRLFEQAKRQVGVHRLVRFAIFATLMLQTRVAIAQNSNARFIDVQTTCRITRQFEMYDPHSKEALQTLKAMGFTQVILDWPQLHKEATELGLNVVLANWWIKSTPPEQIQSAIDFAKQVDPKHLVGISMMDEPNRNHRETPFGFYLDTYQTLRCKLDAELPGVRLEISHWGPLKSWERRQYDYFSDLYEATDVMRIMPYPDLYERPLNDVYFMMQRSRKIMKELNREVPLLVILQTWVLPPKSKLPTIDELRVMAYQAMLGGAQTVSFFEYNLEIWNQTPGFHDLFEKLMKELTDLSQEFADATITSSINAEGILTALIIQPDGKQVIFEVNTNREACGELKSLEVLRLNEDNLRHED